MGTTIAAWMLLSLLQDDAELGYKAYGAGRFAEAADRFEKALVKQKTPQLWTAFGHASLQAERWEPAIGAYREVIALKADTADIHRSLARALSMAGRIDEAIASLRKAGTLDPDGSDSLSIARLRIQREEWLQAEFELISYLRSVPSSIEGLESLAFVLGRLGKPNEAVEFYRNLERRHPTETKYRTALARLAASQTHYGEAIESLEALRLLGGLKEEDERLLADLYLQEKMYAEAAACYARRLAVSASPKADDAYRLGHAYYESKQWTSAKEAFQKVLSIDPAHGGAFLYLGHLAFAQGKADEARKDFTEAFGRMPDSPQPALALGNLELKESSFIKAAEAYREALKRGATDSSVWYDLVFSWVKAGRRDEARVALKEALRQWPLDERFRGLLQEIER
jgi:tetratricopeptide (TPR) repeat protein